MTITQLTMNKIENQKQVEITKKWILDFKESLDELNKRGDE